MANALGEFLGGVATAIRDMTGDPPEVKMKPVDFPGKIRSIKTGADVSGVTATAEDVLNGKVIVDADGNTVTGTIKNNGTVNAYLRINQTSSGGVKYLDGYYKKGSSVEVSAHKLTITPTKEGKSHNTSYYYPVIVEPIPDQYQDVTGVTATAEDVRAGKVFVDAQGNEIVGTLVENTANPDDEAIFELQRVEGFAPESTFGAYSPGYVSPAAFVLEEGKTYRVSWDGESHTCVAFTFEYSGYPITAIGNASSLGLQGNNEPFLITYNVSFDNTQIYSTQKTEYHDIGIYQEVSGEESTGDVVWAGSAGGVAGSQIGSGIIRYVIFKNHDGTVEYGRKSVIKGENCVDPVTAGHMDSPTRESDVQYNYTYAGWATEPNGGLNADALKNVTEDRTVYANFVAAVRYYTITFYDEDGTTVLATKSVAYGSKPSYIPTKEGYIFAEWVPELAAVTGPTSYTATWSAKPAFETATWEEIAAVCDAGLASSTFAIGDKKPVTLTYEDGTSETIDFRIVDMGVDKVKGGGLASLTLMADNIVAISPIQLNTSAYGKAEVHDFDNVKTFISQLYAALPSDLQPIIKPYTYYVLNANYQFHSNLFIPHSVCLGVSNDYGNGTHRAPDCEYSGVYKYFANGGSIKRTKLANANVDDYWTSSVGRTGTDTYTAHFYTVIDGTARTSSPEHHQQRHGIVPCFCI